MQVQMMSSSLGSMGSLLGKLHTLLVSTEHHKLPKSLKVRMWHLKQDLEELNSFLLDLSRLKGPNAMVERWMNEVRELSYDMEDYIDSTMSSKMMDSREMKKEILSVIKQFRNLVKQARERHDRYELRRWASNPSCMDSMVDGQDMLPSVNNRKAKELVGIGESKGELIRWLSNVGEAGERLKVVSILGPAGVGKSTLAQEVYREIGGQFERRAFVRASRVPDIRRLLRGMISQVRRHQQPRCGLPVQELIDNLRTHLQQKRYFIVIDGLWETASWDIIKSAFPEDAHCSRLLITTNIEKVSLECCSYQSNASVTWAPESMLDSDSNFHNQVGIFKMEPLSTDDSMELFFNRVFGFKPELSEQLKKYSVEIIRKCSGLPLATIIISSVFACQPDNSELWRHIKEFLSSRNNLSSEDLLKEIIGLSYYSLSQQLKTCLLYLSLYPEGYTFMKADFVKQWAAEGFTTEVAGKGTNEVLECYFDELVRRGLVHPSHIDIWDKVVFYTMHSTIFEVIRRKSIEENFTTVIDYSETIPKLSAKVRRLSLSFSNAKYATMPEGFTLSTVRSLTFYGLVECLPSIMELKLLRVLILEFWGNREVFDLSGIHTLLQLRYIKITTDSTIKLPIKMRGLQYLETLEIYASILTVPSDIVYLPKLLHLHLQGDIKLPDYIGNLKSLRTLQSFDLSSNSEDNVRSLGEMTNLHDLHISCSTAVSDGLERNLIALASSIGKHDNLKSLTLAPGVSCTSIYTDCSSIVSSPPVSLEKLELLPPMCIFSRLPEWIGQLQKLCILKIVVRELKTDDVNRISGLQKLTLLFLYVRQPTAQSLVFNRAAFPTLKYLKFRCGVLRLAFQAGAIPNLRRLKLEFNAHSGQQYSDMISGIEHLLNLQEIGVRIGAAPGAEDSDRTDVETVFWNTISKHSRRLNISIRRADSVDEVIPQFSHPAASSSHLDDLLYRPSIVADATSQSNEIEQVEVDVASLHKATSDADIQTYQPRATSTFPRQTSPEASESVAQNLLVGKSPTRKPSRSCGQFTSNIKRGMATDASRGGKPSLLSTLPKQLPAEFLKEITNGFSADRKLGQGAFGTVYQGFLQDGEPIAVKKLSYSSPVAPTKQFNNEVGNLMAIQHKNIVRLVGYCHEEQKKVIEHNGRYILVDVVESLLCYEYCPKGNLDKCIFDASSRPDWKTCFKIIKGICQGLHFLHREMDRPIVHLDLQPANILLDANMVPKISDFGLSRLFGEEQTRINTINVVGAKGYMAPEYLYRGEISTWSDIYSLGVLIMEITIGEKNFPSDQYMSASYFVDKVRQTWTDEHIASKYSSLDAGSLQEVKACIEIGLKCVDIDQKKRPTIVEIVDKLNGRHAH